MFGVFRLRHDNARFAPASFQPFLRLGFHVRRITDLVEKNYLAENETPFKMSL
jgi:hypothetical protein